MSAETGNDRYFFALWPARQVRHGLAQAAREWLGPERGPHRRTMASRFHLTLLYLGSIGHAQADRLKALLEHPRAQRWEAFDLILDRTGHFGSKVAWIGCSDIPPALRQLHEGLVRSTSEAGIFTQLEQEFVPHVTVSRHAGSRWLPSGPLDRPIRWPVRDFLLMRSMPSQGFAYRTVSHMPLVPIRGD
jgi:RNA 2',3'-cyclic 3'-phosphodiesterase